MRSVTFASLFAFALAVAVTGPVGPAKALDCPEPQAHDADGVLAESEGQIRALASIMGSGSEENDIRVVAHDLMEKNKDVSREEIVNYMTAVFCTEVAGDDGLSDSEKATKIEAFDQQVMSIE